MMKQKNIPWLGALVDSAFNTLPVLSVVNFLSIIVVLYATIRPQLLVWAPWMGVWTFFGMMCGVGLVIMVLIYIFVLPSLWTFRGKQMFGFESQIIDKLKVLQEAIDKMEGDRTKIVGGVQYRDIEGQRWGYHQNCLSKEHAQTVIEALEKKGHKARIMPCISGEYGVWRQLT